MTKTLDTTPFYRVRASRLMMGLAIVYLVLGTLALMVTAAGHGVWGHALKSATSGSLLTVPSVLVAALALFAIPALLLFTGSRAVYLGRPWGRVAGVLVAGLLLIVVFPYGFILGCALFWALIADWPPPAKLKLPKPPQVASESAPPVLPKGSNTPWNDPRIRRFKRPKRRSR